MSMYLSVAKFEIQNEKLDADYSNISKDVAVTDFLNSLIFEDYISSFSAFEEDEEIKYSEISNKYISKLSGELDEIIDGLLSDLIKTSGISKREEITAKIQDIILLNRLIKIFLLNHVLNDSSTIKILIS